GSLRKDADLLVVKTPNYYDVMIERALENQNTQEQGENK
ncbi:NADH-quinone oxidoreductase subunit I, partial [Campylobacter jejuni]|nr:NADH-quinone oxidoreductase subunit I [Campylobacter jejuni]